MAATSPYSMSIGLDYGTSRTAVVVSVYKNDGNGDCMTLQDFRKQLLTIEWNEEGRNPHALDMVFKAIAEDGDDWRVILSDQFNDHNIHIPRTRCIKFGASNAEKMLDSQSTEGLFKHMAGQDEEKLSGQAIDVLKSSTWYFLTKELGKLTNADAWLSKSMEAMWARRIEPQLRNLLAFMGETAGTLPINVAIGVPSLWKASQARRHVLALARGMGARLNRIDIINEAQSTLIGKFIDGRNSLHLKDGSVLTMFDAGGGTVDIATYRIIRRDPLELELVLPHCVEDSGWHGFETIMMRFKFLLEAHIDCLIPSIPLNGADMEDAFADMVNQLRYQLYAYSLEADRNNAFEIALRHDKLELPEDEGESFELEGLGIFDLSQMRDKLLVLTQPLIRTAIDASVQPAVELLRNHIIKVQTAVQARGLRYTALAVTGGFSQNQYLREIIKASMSKEPSLHNVEILWDTDGYDKAALARGAALYAANSQLRMTLGSHDSSISPVNEAAMRDLTQGLSDTHIDDDMMDLI